MLVVVVVAGTVALFGGGWVMEVSSLGVNVFIVVVAFIVVIVVVVGVVVIGVATMVVYDTDCAGRVEVEVNGAGVAGVLAGR